MIRGIAEMDTLNPSEEIRAYVERLRAIPVFSGVRLGAVRREYYDSREVHAFDIGLEVVPVVPAGLRGLEGRDP